MYNPINEIARLSVRVHHVSPKEALEYVDKGILDCISQMRKKGARSNPERMDKLHARLVRLEGDRARVLSQIEALRTVKRAYNVPDMVMRADMKKSERTLLLSR